MGKKKKKYKCTKCGYETDTLTIGDIRVGCANCGAQGFKKYDKPEYDLIMRHLL